MHSYDIDGASHACTFEQLDEFASMFAGGSGRLLVVVGPPGCAKTTHMRQRIPGALLLDGHITPLEFYVAVASRPDAVLILDDAQDLLKDRKTREYIMKMTDSLDPRTIRYMSSARRLNDAGLRQETTVRNRVVVLTNEWNKGWGALSSRGEVVVFEPSWDELCDYAEPWLGDGEILQYVRQRIPGLRPPADLRRLTKAKDRKDAGFVASPWQGIIDDVCDERLLKIHELRARDMSERERARAFKQAGCGSERTYWRLKKTITI